MAWGSDKQSNNSTIKGKKYSLNDSNCDDRAIMISVTGVASNMTSAPTGSTSRLRMLATTTGSATMAATATDFSTTETASESLIDTTTDVNEDYSFANGLKISSTFIVLIASTFMVMFQ